MLCQSGQAERQVFRYATVWTDTFCVSLDKLYDKCFVMQLFGQTRVVLVYKSYMTQLLSGGLIDEAAVKARATLYQHI